MANSTGTPNTAHAVAERRSIARTDRRAHSRSGRRDADPHTNWRRIAWLFGGYALYLSARALPSAVKRWLRRTGTPA